MKEGSFPRELIFCSIALKMSTSAFKLGGSGNLITLVVREEDLSSDMSFCLSRRSEGGLVIFKGDFGFF